ncbi:MAG TPA: OmpA family protein [Burkholderiales bacterium]|nr:OmpA family protein [Burkholderiales bacterium]
MSIHRHVSSAALVTLFAATGCVTQGEFDKLQSEKNQEITSLQSSRSALEQQVRNLESQRESLEKQGDSLTKEKDSLTREKDSLAKERDSLTQQVAALEAQRAQLQATEKQSETRYDALLANLSEEVRKGQLQVRQLKGMLTVDVAEQLFFDSGRANLKDTGKQVLQKVAESLKGYEDKAIRIVGHTDNVPITKGLQKVFPSNWELSAARATTVVRFLQDAGIAPERLVATGRAEYAPVSPNDTAEGRQKNRRIEITLIDRGVLQ